jgi:hypothetical protein
MHVLRLVGLPLVVLVQVSALALFEQEGKSEIMAGEN